MSRARRTALLLSMLRLISSLCMLSSCEFLLCGRWLSVPRRAMQVVSCLWQVVCLPVLVSLI